jgi:hypothetical protein
MTTLNLRYRGGRVHTHTGHRHIACESGFGPILGIAVPWPAHTGLEAREADADWSWTAEPIDCLRCLLKEER